MKENGQKQIAGGQAGGLRSKIDWRIQLQWQRWEVRQFLGKHSIQKHFFAFPILTIYVEIAN